MREYKSDYFSKVFLILGCLVCIYFEKVATYALQSNIVNTNVQKMKVNERNCCEL